jgi:hypothetical protein
MIRAAATAINGGYTAGLRIPIREGRPFLPADRLGSQPVALVSASFAARAWPDRNAVGQRLRTFDRTIVNDPLGPWRTVVGVVGDVRQMPADDDLADVYLPYLQVPSPFAVVLIRSPDDAGRWLRELRHRVGQIDPAILVSTVTPLRALHDRAIASRRFLASMLSGPGRLWCLHHTRRRPWRDRPCRSGRGSRRSLFGWRSVRPGGT